MLNQDFSDFLQVFHLAPCDTRFTLGDFLILVHAAMAKPLQCVMSVIVLTKYLIYCALDIPTHMQ